jgi:hypothetical protein
MEPHILLSQLKALLARTPTWASYSPTSPEHQQWLGQAHALMSRWDETEALHITSHAALLSSLSLRNNALGEIFGLLHRAAADLELEVSAEKSRAFGSGAIYDFFIALTGVLKSAQHSLLIVDPYMDEEIFDAYLSSVPNDRARVLPRFHGQLS